MAEFMFPNMAYRATVYRTGVFYSQLHKTDDGTEQICVAYKCKNHIFETAFASCLCPDVEKLKEMVEEETNEKGKPFNVSK